jgi:hypothetical protein
VLGSERVAQLAEEVADHREAALPERGVVDVEVHAAQKHVRRVVAAGRKTGPTKRVFALRAYQPFAWRVYPPAAAP